MNWRAFFTWVPSWVPCIGCDSVASIESAITGFNSMKTKLKNGILKANDEKTKAKAMIDDYNAKIADEDAKRAAAEKAIVRANKVIKNIDDFLCTE